MTTEILVKKIILDGGKVRFDLIGKNLPENFLGLASDLKFAGGAGDIKYEKMEWGNAFAGFATEDLPVKMVKYAWETGRDEGRIIFGISLKAGDLKILKDGVIGSFYFSGKASSNIQFAGFQYEVLSAYENGRVDVTGVKWLNAGQLKMPGEVISTGTTLDNIQNKESVELKSLNQPAAINTSDLAKALSSKPVVYSDEVPLDEDSQIDLLPTSSVDLSGSTVLSDNKQSSLFDQQFLWWILPLLIGLFILLLGAWIYWKKRAASRTWQYS